MRNPLVAPSPLAGGYGGIGQGIFSSTPVAEAVTSLLLDAFPNAAAAYSTSRQLDPNQVAAMDVRESGGDTEATINYSGGVLDEAALLSHCGANDGFVVKLYDHSGNSEDAPQATVSSQPKIVNAGVVVKENGKPALQGALGDLLQKTFAAALSQPVTIIAVAAHGGSAGTEWMIDGASNNFLFGVDSTDRPNMHSGFGVAGSAITSAQKLWFGVFDDDPGTTNGSFLDINQTSEITGGNTGSNTMDGITIGNFKSDANAWKGTIQEIIIYSGDKTAVAQEQGFEIVASRPQSIADCWEFWIEGEADLPDFIQESDADFRMDEPEEVRA